MEVKGYLVIKKGAKSHHPPAPEWRTKKPTALPQNQVAIMVTVNIPSEYFERPELHMAFRLPELTKGGKVEVTEVADFLEKAVKDRFGVTVHII